MPEEDINIRQLAWWNRQPTKTEWAINIVYSGDYLELVNSLTTI